MLDGSYNGVTRETGDFKVTVGNEIENSPPMGLEPASRAAEVVAV